MATDSDVKKRMGCKSSKSPQDMGLKEYESLGWKLIPIFQFLKIGNSRQPSHMREK